MMTRANWISSILVLTSIGLGARWFWLNDPSGPVNGYAMAEAFGIGALFLAGAAMLRAGRRGAR
jgi:hypothetical protein